jgi:2-methylcitrate dehydratase PrpD
VPSPSEDLARFVATATFEQIPGDMIEQARKLTLDAIGCGLLGSRMELAPTLLDVLGGSPDECEAIVLGYGGERRSLLAATTVNVAFIHQTELGEGVSRATVHTSTVVVPTALALAQQRRVSGKDFLRAVALGCETFIRFGYAASTDPANKEQAAGKGDHAVALQKGFAPISGLAPLASAAVAGVLWNFDPETMHRAFGVAVCQCPMTPVAIIHEGSTGKGAFCGVATANGIISARLAAAGVTGISDIVGTWFPMWLPAFDPSKLNSRLGQHYELSYIGFKYLASIGPTHASIQATFDILEESGPLAPDEIDDILIEGYVRVQYFYTPPPVTTAEAVKTNVAACVAEAIVWRDRNTFLLEAFTPKHFLDPRNVVVSKKVRVVVKQEYEDLYPFTSSKVCVTIRMKDGRAFRREFDRNSERRYHYPERSDIEAKFRAVTRRSLSAEVADKVIDAVWNLDASDDAGHLVELLSADTR